MKKISILFAFALYSLVLSCTDKESTIVEDNSNSRIKVKEIRTINGETYTIIEVDSTEYLTKYTGGFIKLGK